VVQAVEVLVLRCTREEGDGGEGGRVVGHGCSVCHGAVRPNERTVDLSALRSAAPSPLDLPE
jgi:hypothetical protein